ncbi:MAG: response regulator transcription factor [Syntrophomonadaceae bacterium]|jgi:DNA-binding response OmpR family regulator|nr:response regulator transcription factor [Syntrophomonadaceae bacterium]
MYKILIIEDEEKIARFLELELLHENYEIYKAFDGKRGLEIFQLCAFDLVLLDIMLPEISGIEVLRKIRRTSSVPVIILTARDSTVDKVFGLDGGADDYITKPFSIEELMARIRVALRKKTEQARINSEECLSCGDLRLFPQHYLVTYADSKKIDLTKKEFDLLKMLLANKNLVLTREKLIEQVWGYDYLGETNIVDVYIRYLRGKIDDVFGKRIIHTIRGVGYVIKDDEAKERTKD